MRSFTALFLVASLAGSIVACDRDEDEAGPAAATPAATEPTFFKLPGDRFFPEGIAAAPDGRLFVGSLATGTIAVRSPGEDEAKEFISAAASGMKGAVGLTVDRTRGVLWACAADISFSSPAAIKSFDLATGETRSSATFPGRAICNDLTLDEKGTVYMTDSFGGAIYRLPRGASAVELWSKDVAFAGPPPGEHSVNGIVWDGKGSLYATRTDKGELFRIPIGADGAAGTPAKIALDRDLVGPDGLVVLDDGALVITEHSGGMLARVALEGDRGTVTTLTKDLVEPTTLVTVGTDAWIVEGQLAQLFNPGAPPPELPFRVRRVPLR